MKTSEKAPENEQDRQEVEALIDHLEAAIIDHRLAEINRSATERQVIDRLIDLVIDDCEAVD